MSALLRNLVFKVIGIEESGFVEKTNLRVGRINLNFSITDVQWHPVDGKYSLSMQTCLFNREAHAQELMVVPIIMILTGMPIFHTLYPPITIFRLFSSHSSVGVQWCSG